MFPGQFGQVATAGVSAVFVDLLWFALQQTAAFGSVRRRYAALLALLSCIFDLEAQATARCLERRRLSKDGLSSFDNVDPVLYNVIL